MNRFVLPFAAVAALSLAPAALAEDNVDTAHAVETTEATPVKLVSWDGEFELLKTSRRLRIWRSHLAYKLTVDSEGEITDCELTESFRMKSVSIRLCEILTEHHTFEPALDANGQPTEGSYSARISYQELRDKF